MAISLQVVETDFTTVIAQLQVPVKWLEALSSVVFCGGERGLSRYSPPHPAAFWPLSANILDPVRLSVVCQVSNPHKLRQVSWTTAA